MKRDVQIGVILGVIILAIIGVFLSTRTAVKEPAIPVPEPGEDTEVAVLNMNDLPTDVADISQDSFRDLSTKAQNTDQKEPVAVHVVKKQEPLASKDDAVIEGECEKSKAETVNILTKRTASPSEKEDFLNLTSDKGKSSFVNKQQQAVSQKTKKESATPSLSLIIDKDTSNSTGKKHTIQQGDSLYKIALKYYNDGSKWNKILDANKAVLKNKNALKVGQELVIPNL
jgi:LysM repeat protein